MANRRKKYSRKRKLLKKDDQDTDSENNNSPEDLPIQTAALEIDINIMKKGVAKDLDSSSSESESDSFPEMEVKQVKLHRSRGRSYRLGYKVETLKVAYMAVMNKGMSVYLAAQKFKVPQSTLRDRVLGRISKDVTQSGPPTIFRPEEEAGISSYMRLFAEIGCPLSRLQVRELSADLARYLNRRDYSEGKTLSLRWYYKFIGRFPESQTSKYTYVRMKDLNYGYYKKLTDVYDTLGLKVAAKRVFSLDAVNVYKGGLSMVCEEFSETDSEYDCASRLVFIGCANAAGRTLPPCYVFPDDTDAHTLKTVSKIQNSTIIKVNKSSEQTSLNLNPIFFKEYFEGHFNRNVKLRSKDYVIFYDSARITVPLSLWIWGQKNNIIFFPTLPVTTKIDPPLRATGCLYGVDKMFENEQHRFVEENGRPFSMPDVCKSLNRSYQCLSSTHLKQVFQSMGVYPLPERNPGLLKYDDLVDDGGKVSNCGSKKDTRKLPRRKTRSSALKNSPAKKKAKIVPRSDDESSDDDYEECAQVQSHVCETVKVESGASPTPPDTTQYLSVDWTGLMTSATHNSSPEPEYDPTEPERVVMSEPVHTVDHQYSTLVKIKPELATDNVLTGRVDDCTYYVYLGPEGQTATDCSSMPVAVAEEVIIPLS